MCLLYVSICYLKNSIKKNKSNYTHAKPWPILYGRFITESIPVTRKHFKLRAFERLLVVLNIDLMQIIEGVYK